MSYLIRAICIRLRKINNYFHNRKFRHIFKQCGTNLLVYGIPRITATDKIIIGNNVNLNNGCVLNVPVSTITICDNVTISANAMILAATYDTKLFLEKNDRCHIDRSVYIGNNVWICAGAIICPGVTIACGVIIAAGSVVISDITESDVLVAGNPAKIVKRY